MDIPSVIKIGGHRYSFKRVKKIRHEEDPEAIWDGTKLEILVKQENYATEGRWLLHEILHAIDDIYNCVEELTEAQVDAISEGLYDFLRNNKIGWCED